jgi:hypothetical protein
MVKRLWFEVALYLGADHESCNAASAATYSHRESNSYVGEVRLKRNYSTV